MSRILVLSLVVASLSTIVGCGASTGATRQTASPASVNVAEATQDECWTPPGEVAMSFAQSKAPATPTTDKAAVSSYRPNRNDRPTTGAVHAAAY